MIKVTLYDRYNVELAAKQIKSVALENFKISYSLTNDKKTCQQLHSKTYVSSDKCCSLAHFIPVNLFKR